VEQAKKDRDRWPEESRDLTDDLAEAVEEIERLQAVVERLPKIWRLDESGTLVQDCPCVPDMTAWVVDQLNDVIAQFRVTAIELLDSEEWWIGLDRRPCSGCEPDQLYNTPEAAEAARGDGKEGE